jgi:hypothetical protein
LTIPELRVNEVVSELISQKAANGDYTENPFNFQHFNLSEVTLKVNGVEVYGTSLKLNFGKSTRDFYSSDIWREFP